MNFKHLLLKCLFLLIFCQIVVEARLRALDFDIECPFLTDREYEERMAKGRCPLRAEKPTTTKKPTQAPDLKHSIFLASAQKKLLKFVYFGKQRTVKITFKRGHVQNFTAIEGSFLDIKCDLNKKEANETQIRWFFDGLPLNPSAFDWRVQSTHKNQRLLLAPTLVQYDSGLFECYVNDDFRGGVQLRVVTIWESVFNGFHNYMIGMAFSFPLIIFAAAYRLYRPEQIKLANEFLYSNEDENDFTMQFDEVMLNLKKVEQN